MTLDPETNTYLEAFKKIKLPRAAKIKFPDMNWFDWLMLIIAVVGIILAVYFWWDGSQQISELRKELDQTKNELNQNMSYKGRYEPE